MFFYISGMAATYFNTEGKGFARFLFDKIMRLLLPFVIAIFIFLIPRLYFGQEYEDFTRPDGEIEDNFWVFTQKTLPDIFSKLSWLWYLPALFIDCILTYPLLAWTVRRARKIPWSERDDGNTILM
jgi:fucose 4-O-acetylase-like acetyltransferase